MRYRNANKVLPESLILEIQNYIQGEYLYIPALSLNRKKWGDKSGIRKALETRNEEIRKKYRLGLTITDLADEY